jgi:hypothetical protein
MVHNVCAELERPLQIRRHHGVVDRDEDALVSLVR